MLGEVLVPGVLSGIANLSACAVRTTELEEREPFPVVPPRGVQAAVKMTATRRQGEVRMPGIRKLEAEVSTISLHGRSPRAPRAGSAARAYGIAFVAARPYIVRGGEVCDSRTRVFAQEHEAHPLT